MEFMKRFILIILFPCTACIKQVPVEAPVGRSMSQEELTISKNRTKSLNLLEREQIEQWIKLQDKDYYPMTLNYWADVEELIDQPRRKNGEMVSYQYDIYDFDNVKMYDQPIIKNNVILGKIEELKPVEDAVRHLYDQTEVTLLVPSALGFGPQGDADRIPNDMPLIIKLKLR